MNSPTGQRPFPAHADATSKGAPSALERVLSSRLWRAWRLSLALSPAHSGAAIALLSLLYGIATVHGHGVTYDEPALMWAGDRTLYWLQHLGAEGTLDLQAKDPADFHSAFERKPQETDAYHYPVLPGLIAAATSWLVHDKLDLLNPIDAHHLGLLWMHAVALCLFCWYMTRLFGGTAAIAGTLALAMYPSAVGHSFNNAKDWPCANYYGCFILAMGCGVMDARFRDLLAAGVLLGIAFACKMNAAFGVVSMVLWTPLAYLVLYRRRQLPVEVAAGYPLIPYVAGAVFFISWPWLYQGRVLDWWMHLHEYVRFMLDFGVGQRETWSWHSVKCVWYMSPPLVLAAAAVFLAIGWRGTRRELASYSLLVIWLGLPLLRIAVPRSNYYDANRHFIEYIPALCACAGVGAALAAKQLSLLLHSGRIGSRSGRYAHVLQVGLALGACAILAWPVLEYRPFETTYFNSFIGGLGGAQKQGLFADPPPQDWRVRGTEGDYWFGSVRLALRSAVKFAEPGKKIGVCGPPEWLARANWVGEGERELVGDQQAPPTYPKQPVVVAVWREGPCGMAQIRELERQRRVLRRVKRGNGLIYEVLGRIDGREHPVRTPASLYAP